MYLLCVSTDNDNEMPKACATFDEAVEEMRRDFASTVGITQDEAMNYNEEDGCIHVNSAWFNNDHVNVSWDIYEFDPLTLRLGYGRDSIRRSTIVEDEEWLPF